MNRDLILIGAATSLGQPKAGTELAPSWLRLKGLSDVLGQHFQTVIDRGDLTTIGHEEIKAIQKQKEDAKNLDLNSEYWSKLADLVAQDSATGRFVLTVGGDHGIATGTITGLRRTYPKHKIIWVDAHGDLNTPETSPSGNMHGMPLGILLGLSRDKRLNTSLSFTEDLKPEDVVIIGARDLDEGEKSFIKERGIRCYSNEDVSKLGIDRVMKETLDYLSPDGDETFHLSFDVDGIDPHFFPSTGTAVDKGLSLEEGKFIIESLSVTGRLRSMDLVEVNPMLGNENDVLKTAESTLDLMTALRPAPSFLREGVLNKYSELY